MSRAHIRHNIGTRPPVRPHDDVPLSSLILALLFGVGSLALLLFLPEARAGLVAIAEWVTA